MTDEEELQAKLASIPEPQAPAESSTSTHGAEITCFEFTWEFDDDDIMSLHEDPLDFDYPPDHPGWDRLIEAIKEQE